MASPHSTMTVQDQIRCITDCDICSEALKDPRILPCFHIFCLRCIGQSQELTKLSSSSGEEGVKGRPIRCPVCRREFTIPTNGFEGLKKNVFIERMIETRKMLDRSQGQTPCDACTDETTNEPIAIAARYCLECNLNLCQQCSAHHGRSRLTKEHRLREGANLTNARELEEALDSRMCRSHTDEEMKLYCKNCSVVLCPMCFIESHQGHERLSLVEAGDDFRRQIKDSISSIDICTSKAIMKEELIEREMDRTTQRTTQLEEEITKRRDDLKELIDDHARLLQQQLQTKTRKKIREAVTERDDNEIHVLGLEGYKNYCSSFVSYATNGEICRATSDLKARATELRAENDAAVQRQLSLCKLSFNATELDKFSSLVENIIGKIEDSENEELALNGSWMDEKDTTSEESYIDANSDFADLTSKSDPENEELGLNGSWMDEKDTTPEESSIDTNTDIVDLTSQSALGSAENSSEASAENSDMIIPQQEQPASVLGSAENSSEASAENSDAILPQQEQPASVLGSAENSCETSAENSDAILPQQEQPASGTKESMKSPVLVQTLTTNIAEKEGRPIWGVTSLNNELYIVTERSSLFEVYDLVSLSFKRKWNLRKLKNPQDITSCAKDKCLYVLDWNLAMIFRLNSNGPMLSEWSVPKGEGRLSVTHESNVLLTVYEKNRLIEYRADGHPVCDIKLSSVDGILHPQHAVKLPNGGFVVSHGALDDPLHRVCIVDGSGKMLKSIGGKPGWAVGKMNIPLHLAVNSDGSILVADWINGRVLLLSSQLEFKKELLSKKDGLRHPGRICLNETNGQLIVADNLDGWSDGQVRIYNI